MGNVVSSQESRHEVGNGASLSTVRPEQERAQASFPTGKVRFLVIVGPPCSGPHRPGACAASSGETVTHGRVSTADTGHSRNYPSQNAEVQAQSSSEPTDAISGEQRGGLVVESDLALSSVHPSPSSLHQAV